MEKIKVAIKHTLYNIFGGFGYDISRRPHKDVIRDMIYPVRTTSEEIYKFLSTLGFEPKTVFDVGVAIGTPELYKTYPNAEFILIEPLKEFEGHLQKICAQYKAQYYLGAAGSIQGRFKLCVSPDLVNSSLFYQDSFVEREVPMFTLDQIAIDCQLQGPCLIKVDAQGGELSVLQGAENILELSEMVILEVSFFSFTKGMPQFYDIVNFMKQRSFVIYEIWGGHNRPFDKARAQANVVFVKEEGVFRKTSEWATPAQAELFYTKRSKDMQEYFKD
jgi:FkbM family methyltransferase